MSGKTRGSRVLDLGPLTVRHTIETPGMIHVYVQSAPYVTTPKGIPPVGASYNLLVQERHQQKTPTCEQGLTALFRRSIIMGRVKK